MNCTNRLPHWDEQQPKHLSDIRRVGRGLTGHGVVLLATWSASAVVNQHGDLASHSAICRTELSYPRNLGKHNRARIFFVLPWPGSPSTQSDAATSCCSSVELALEMPIRALVSRISLYGDD